MRGEGGVERGENGYGGEVWGEESECGHREVDDPEFLNVSGIGCDSFSREISRGSSQMSSGKRVKRMMEKTGTEEWERVEDGRGWKMRERKELRTVRGKGRRRRGEVHAQVGRSERGNWRKEGER